MSSTLDAVVHVAFVLQWNESNSSVVGGTRNTTASIRNTKSASSQAMPNQQTSPICGESRSFMLITGRYRCAVALSARVQVRGDHHGSERRTRALLRSHGLLERLGRRPEAQAAASQDGSSSRQAICLDHSRQMYNRCRREPRNRQ